MTVDDWHVARADLRRWHGGTAAPAADRRDAAFDVMAASIEEHLLGCATCRVALTEEVGGSPTAARSMAASWTAIADRIDRPGRTLPERLLAAIGVGEGWARLVASTPALRLAALAGAVVMAVLAVVMSLRTDTDVLFLAVAPLVPLAAVATAFSPAADPAGEAGVATPLHGGGLLLRRTAVVLTFDVCVLALASLALHDRGLRAFAWLLPAIAVTATALALTTWRRAEIATGAAALAWTIAVWVGWWANAGSVTTEAGPFGPAGQVGSVAIALVALVVTAVRRHRLFLLEVRS
jgi:hypothetical protein